MKVPASLGAGLGLGLVALFAVGGVIYLVSKNSNLFNPTQAGNLADTAANSVVEVLTGDKNQTVGGWFYDLFNPGAGLLPGETSSGGIITPVPVTVAAAAIAPATIDNPAPGGIPL